LRSRPTTNNAEIENAKLLIKRQRREQRSLCRAKVLLTVRRQDRKSPLKIFNHESDESLEEESSEIKNLFDVSNE